MLFWTAARLFVVVFPLCSQFLALMKKSSCPSTVTLKGLPNDMALKDTVTDHHPLIIGFARNSNWEYVGILTDNDEVSVRFCKLSALLCSKTPFSHLIMCYSLEGPSADPSPAISLASLFPTELHCCSHSQDTENHLGCQEWRRRYIWIQVFVAYLFPRPCKYSAYLWSQTSVSTRRILTVMFGTGHQQGCC